MMSYSARAIPYGSLTSCLHAIRLVWCRNLSCCLLAHAGTRALLHGLRKTAIDRALQLKLTPLSGLESRPASRPHRRSQVSLLGWHGTCSQRAVHTLNNSSSFTVEGVFPGVLCQRCPDRVVLQAGPERELLIGVKSDAFRSTERLLSCTIWRVQMFRDAILYGLVDSLVPVSIQVTPALVAVSLIVTKLHGHLISGAATVQSLKEALETSLPKVLSLFYFLGNPFLILLAQSIQVRPLVFQPCALLLSSGCCRIGRHLI
mmetsp:Transcript_6522/g.12551  ORF Transcript_6522/g.12551 Transcript_6522/m.12551 type:complete len:260 (-) Transcript_6522:288-1067(-)